MGKNKLIWHIFYYLLTVCIYMAFFYCISLIFRLSGEADNLGAVIAVTYGVLFLATPILLIVLMRFSLLKWYVDPIASAEIPFFLYCLMVINQMKHTAGFTDAVLLVNKELCDDGGGGWCFLIGLFFFGLAASFSFARKEEKSISYRLLSRLYSD